MYSFYIRGWQKDIISLIALQDRSQLRASLRGSHTNIDAGWKKIYIECRITSNFTPCHSKRALRYWFILATFKTYISVFKKTNTTWSALALPGNFLYWFWTEPVFSLQVVIACVTPKYIVSHHCNRELGLADLLRKHIIPVMFDRVPWPPPGGMALTFSQLIYINMKGTVYSFNLEC